MVRKPQLKEINIFPRKPSAKGFLSSFLFLAILICSYPSWLKAADTQDQDSAKTIKARSSETTGLVDAKSSENTNPDDKSDVKKMVLKIMVVNPSSKFQQKYPLKAALPAEILPQHIISKEDLQIAFDADKSAYYLTQEVLLDPGQSVVKTIVVEDIWLIPQDQLNGISQEAAKLMERVEGTGYESKARLLIQNTEVLLTQIFESQNDSKLTPDQHISVFHENKQKLKEIELDLVALRRLVFEATGDHSIMKLGDGESASMGFIGKGFKPELISRNLKGAIPASVAWKIIFIILVFIGLAVVAFYFIWYLQLKSLEDQKKKAEKIKKKETTEEILFKELIENSQTKINPSPSGPKFDDTKPR